MKRILLFVSVVTFVLWCASYGVAQSEGESQASNETTAAVAAAGDIISSAVERTSAESHLKFVRERDDYDLKAMFRELEARNMSLGPSVSNRLELEPHPGGHAERCVNLETSGQCEHRAFRACKYASGYAGSGGSGDKTVYGFCRPPEEKHEEPCSRSIGKDELQTGLEGFVAHSVTENFCRGCTDPWGNYFSSAVEDSSVVRERAMALARENGCEAETLDGCRNDHQYIDEVLHQVWTRYEQFKGGRLPDDAEPEIVQLIAREFIGIEFAKHGCSHRCQHENRKNRIQCTIVFVEPCEGVVGSVCRDALGEVRKVQIWR